MAKRKVDRCSDLVTAEVSCDLVIGKRGKLDDACDDFLTAEGRRRRRDWSRLPSHLLGLLRSFISPPEYFRFSAVCSNWHLSEVETPSPNGKPKSIWLMTPPLQPDVTELNLWKAPKPPEVQSDEEDDCLRNFYSISEKRSYTLRVPNLRGHRCIGSSGCWLVALDRSKELHLVNPITGTKLTLPSLTTFSGVKINRRGPNGDVTGFMRRESKQGHQVMTVYSLLGMEYYYRKVIVFSSQETETTMMVFVIHSSSGHIAYARPGDVSWNELVGYGNGNGNVFQDIALHKGKLYGVGSKGDVMMIGDVTCPTCTYLPRPKWGDVDDPVGWIGRFYLVESSDGEDLMVVRRSNTASSTNNNLNFLVFRLLDSGCKWVREWNLGESALLLGENRSMALSIRDFPELEGNCIYFSDVKKYGNGYDQSLIDSQGTGTGIFHMSGNNITPCYESQFRRPRVDSKFSWHLWLLPALR